MGEGAGASRSALAHEVARCLTDVSGSELKGLPALRVAKKRLDELLAAAQIPEGEYRQLFYLLQSLEGCGIDRCDRIEDLVQEVTTSLTIWPEVFSDEELERLRGLL